MAEEVVGEERVGDVRIRYLEGERDGEPHYWAAGAPMDDEWCFLAGAELLIELEVAARAIVEQDETRGIFLRCAALMGVAWNDGEMVALLEAQEYSGCELMRKAPDTAKAEIEDLRLMRREAGEEFGTEN